jgi:hypothetical protein
MPWLDSVVCVKHGVHGEKLGVRMMTGMENVAKTFTFSVCMMVIAKKVG